MERLYSVQLFPSDLEAADRALQACIAYDNQTVEERADLTSARTALLFQASQYPDRHKFLLTDIDIVAILNGIAILDESDEIKLHGPNGHPDEKFRTLQSNLLYELNRDR
jgi:hypothetical protein